MEGPLNLLLGQWLRCTFKEKDIKNSHCGGQGPQFCGKREIPWRAFSIGYGA
jgi:hypothetical protein